MPALAIVKSIGWRSSASPYQLFTAVASLTSPELLNNLGPTFASGVGNIFEMCRPAGRTKRRARPGLANPSANAAPMPELAPVNATCVAISPRVGAKEFPLQLYRPRSRTDSRPQSILLITSCGWRTGGSSSDENISQDQSFRASATPTRQRAAWKVEPQLRALHGSTIAIRQPTIWLQRVGAVCCPERVLVSLRISGNSRLGEFAYLSILKCAGCGWRWRKFCFRERSPYERT